MLIDDLLKARNGDCDATDKVIEHYNYLIKFIMNQYHIENKIDCYDAVVERVLKSILKFPL